MQENNRYFLLNTGIQAAMRCVIRSAKPVLMLVAGGSCSGKGYFSDLLERSREATGASVSVVQMDGCFRDFDDPQMPRDGRYPVFDHPGSYHMDEVKKYVADLMRGEDIKYPQYDILENRRKIGEYTPIRAADLVIIEGLFAIRELSDLECGSIIKVFIEASESTRLKRRIERDRKYGIGREDVKWIFYNLVAPLHRKYVEPQILMADIVIVNN